MTAFPDRRWPDGGAMLADILATFRAKTWECVEHAPHQCVYYAQTYGEARALLWILVSSGYTAADACGPELSAALMALTLPGDGVELDVTPIPDPSPDDPEPIPAPGLPPITAEEIGACDLDSLLWVLVDSHPDSATYHGTTD